MKNLKALIFKLSGAIAALSLFAGISSVSQTCWLHFYQPKMPERMKDFK